MFAATPAPTIGQPLPRAIDAYTAPEKWEEWILAERGHGREWARVFHIEPADIERVWRGITEAVLDAPIFKVIDRGPDGIVCGVDMKLTVDTRVATLRTSWHYERAGDAPRLITAYPRF
ncbi:MAG: DUF6883 domain-containing protein [Solirubrobacteraceae bacterium]